MYVEIHTLRAGKNCLAGVLRLEGGALVPEPDCRLLQNILAEPAYDWQTQQAFDAASQPESFLHALCAQYRSPYLRASAPIEDSLRRTRSDDYLSPQ